MCFFRRKGSTPKQTVQENKVEEKKYTYRAVESVSHGHPDIVCDCIADCIKDFILEHDPQARIAVEVAVTTQYVLLLGEVTTSIEKVPYIKLVKDAIRRAGYVHQGKGFDAKNVRIYSRIHEQSKDIAMGTNDSVGGAGDNGIIFGYACNETQNYIPFGWELARALTDKAFECAKKYPNIFHSDSKSQVTVRYCGDKIDGIENLVLCVSHEDIEIEELRKHALEMIIKPVLELYNVDINTIKDIYINPTGKFVEHGPAADSSVTGRKLIVNQYGGFSAIGGGSLQGKDPSKTDNCAALMSRFLAKNVVAAGLADKCQVQLAYAIGIPHVVAVNVECFGTERIPCADIASFIYENIDCSPRGIIDRFDLRKIEKPTWKYEMASAHGWFGREEFPWEEVEDIFPWDGKGC